jgi:hypothetical protein
MTNREELYSTALKDIQYIMTQYKEHKPEAWDTVRKLVNKALHPTSEKKGGE